MSKILKRNSFLKMNEEVFVNDIPWGDSLVGRMVSSFVRKSKISFNNKRIDGVIKSLRSKMDQIVEMSNIDISSRDVKLVKVNSLLRELQKSIKNGDDLDTIISITEGLINSILIGDFDDQDTMLSALNEFLDYIKSLLKPTEDSSEGSSGSDVSVDREAQFYKNSRIFLQSIVDLGQDIKTNVVRSKSKSGEIIPSRFDFDKLKSILSRIENKGKPLSSFITKKIKDRKPLLDEVSKLVVSGIKIFKEGNDKKNLELLQDIWNRIRGYYLTSDEMNFNNPDWVGAYSVYKKKWADDQIKKYGPDANVTKPGEKDRSLIKTQSRNYLISKMCAVDSINESESNLSKSETHAKNAWDKVIYAYNTSGIGKYVKNIEELLSVNISMGKDKYNESKELISNICKQVVMNESTIGKPISYDDLIKEGSESDSISKSISLFSRYLLPFAEDQGLWASYGTAGNHIKLFLDSFKSMSMLVRGDVKESFSFAKFLLIKEKNDFSDQIVDKFNSIFTEDIIKYFDITEEDKRKIESSASKSDKFIISDSDVIIEIVQLFNRAWRLHTPGSIPSGRTGGKVSNSVFREYEYLGSGGGGSPDNPGGGPYRNIKIWDKWYQGISDILADVKYRPIFGKNVTFSFVDEKDGESVKSGDDVKNGGKILLTFITRLLSDTTMYSDKGALPKFINQYFNLKVDDSDKRFSYPGYQDSNKNRNTSSRINVKKVRFMKLENTELTNYYKPMMILSIKNDRGIRYLRIFKINGNIVYGEMLGGLTLQNVEFENVSDIPINEDGARRFYFKIELSKLVSGVVSGSLLLNDGTEIADEITKINGKFIKHILVNSFDGKPYLSRKSTSNDDINKIINRIG